VRPLRLSDGIYDTRGVALPPAPVTDLNDLEKVLSPEPLMTNEELDRFYRPEVNVVRGDDTTARLARRYRSAFCAVPYKTFLMGHPGVGKSTEITRLLRILNDEYRGIRFSIARELNPASFKIFDILMLMMIKAAEEASTNTDAGLLDTAIAKNLLEDVQNYFAEQKITEVQQRTIGGEVQAGIKSDSFWGKLLPVFAAAKGEIKYAGDRKKETVERRLKLLPTLVDLANRLLGFCADSLKNVEGKEWLFVLEDFDRFGISGEQLQEVFVQYGTVFQDLRANLLFTIPVWLGYSQDAGRLPFPKTLIPDTPVFDRYHVEHAEGRRAVQAVLRARVSAELIDQGQEERLIVASGGNLRDLFSMVFEAGEQALARDPNAKHVTEPDVTKAVSAMRREYRRRLGESPYDPKPIHWEEKCLRLVAVYNSEPGSDIPDPALYSLLKSRALQEFNGEGWCGVHPLVVDILIDQKRLKEGSRGGSR
jgi:hypothetical protein